ncbi:DNA adenine methylase [Aliarcobacter butzleri]|uniref:DNA adenine methylase n=1 Tax=Aliarcobacter butzleri TaxID=28197 RepID=UPI0021B166E7|nr:Dam family site-specific DNA-(adenine-N6)-methyltransferase [Aliarcobacter butzleri]MCT7547109.1 Dam family site-specific DNA-(adenine-N6)-methyltransferase [Aliarcobacter butzleri]MDN5081406.1 Dam family site-specific DNA-(adenine-N6)-methyltransferase [Aliarcobacter butzleri]MDN5083566.1 Dam family site-specific DNA-(adenine-N6)-methyltransferase [Aliarcobacter butzleri]
MVKIKRSPMFYVGDKYKLIKEIKQYFPKNINTFIEPFVGGGTVFLNVEANSYILNDIDKNIYNIHLFLQTKACEIDFIDKLLKYIKKYNLSRSFLEDIVPKQLKKEYKKTYYAKFNKQGYDKLKQDFNILESKNYLLLYLLLIYGFNRMIRFNSKGEFNVPVGNVDFNKNVLQALGDYSEFIKNKNIKFENLDFKDFIIKNGFKEDDFMYLDPPYLITFSEYNKIWNEDKEHELLNFLDNLDQRNIKFAISNVTHYKGRVNNIFLDWMKKYNVKKVQSNYISYHDNSVKNIEEVLVINYD